MRRISGRRSYSGTQIRDVKAVSALVLRKKWFFAERGVASSGEKCPDFLPKFRPAKEFSPGEN
ncbi:hypothetical protein A2U01_0049230 [Trifolium medium]|uniref:Uncharacterized protein n=1 Tax=Trifolium medium TaxID=97028 RepID=A0A392QWR1_9FABA|nr:hypothetical protein [Trifolium medium]